MASIYKLVAERRDRNQSLRRKRNARNINFFKDSMEEAVEYRRPALYRHHTLRQRTVSDQPQGQDLQIPRPPSVGIRKLTNDIHLINIKNQIREVDSKIDGLAKKVDDLTRCFVILKSELNKIED